MSYYELLWVTMKIIGTYLNLSEPIKQTFTKRTTIISCQKGAECYTRRKRRRWVVLDVRPIVAFFVRGRNRPLITRNSRNYIIPPIPAPAPARLVSGLSSFFSASTHSVVRNIEAIDAAFSRATRETLVGSIIPTASISS